MMMMIEFFFFYIFFFMLCLVLFWLSNNFKFVLTFCVIIKHFVYPLSLCDKNGEYFLVWFIWYLDRKCISKLVKCFCPRLAKWGVC
jgi:hypothetical protein